MRESVVYAGTLWHRNPEAERRSDRVYYRGGRKGHEFLHRRVWADIHGPIPSGMVIHHVNGDSTDNRPENLVCITTMQHRREHPPDPREWAAAHAKGILAAPAWHASDEGHRWHVAHGRRTFGAETRQEREFVCEECHRTFTTIKLGHVRFCSKACSRRVKDRARAYRREVACPVCGAMFWQSRYREQPKTCSVKCGAVLRSGPRRS